MISARSLARVVSACALLSLPIVGPLACSGGSDGVTAPTGGTTTTPTKTISVAAKAYLDTGLAFTEEVFYYASRMNWATWEQTARTTAGAAQTTADVYPAMDAAIKALNDTHSYFYKPSETLGTSNEPATPFYQVTETTVAPRVAYLWVPTYAGINNAGRADTIQRAIAKGDSTPNLCGWILDLRGNPGGFWAAMLVGLSPLITPGTVGGFVERDTTNRYRYIVGPGSASLFVPGEGNYVVQSSTTSYKAMHADLPIAILQGDITASAGEIIVMAFKDLTRPIRTFGAPTYGATTQPYTYVFSDNSSIQVAAALMFDRNFKNYLGAPIPPDQAVTGPTIRSNYVPGAATDAVITAATTWLNAQPSCAAKASSGAAASRIPLAPNGGTWEQTTVPLDARPMSAWPKGRPTPWINGGSGSVQH